MRGGGAESEVSHSGRTEGFREATGDRVEVTAGLKPGERVTLRYNPARLHFFGADGAVLPRT